MRRILLALLTLVALSATAQSSPRDFANTPAKWLMTASLTISGAETGNSYNLVRDFEVKQP